LACVLVQNFCGEFHRLGHGGHAAEHRRLGDGFCNFLFRRTGFDRVAHCQAHLRFGLRAHDGQAHQGQQQPRFRIKAVGV